MERATYQKVVVSQLTQDFRAATRIVEEALPVLRDEQVLVKNRYAGVNASDVRISAGAYGNRQPPFDVGSESIGTVAAVGPNVTEVRVGDPVMLVGPGVGYREYAVAAVADVQRVPRASPAVVPLMIAGLTASVALDVGGEIRAGQAVLITAAAGGVGSCAVQLAKHAGCYVVGTCGGDEKAPLVKSLGCDRVIDYTQEDIGEVLRKEHPKGVDVTLENVGGSLFDAALRNTAIRGRVVVNGYVSEYKESTESVVAPRIYHELLWHSRTLRGFLLPHYQEHVPAHREKLWRLFESGTLVPVVDRVKFEGVTSVPDAVDHLQAGRNIGKVVVHL